MNKARNPSIPPYRIINDAGGRRYQFYCPLSGAAQVTTAPIQAKTQEEELHLVWEREGRGHFNRCGRCGRWVSGMMFNLDMGQCIECAAWEERPNYCVKCGSPVAYSNEYCKRCGAKLRYREEDATGDDSGTVTSD